MTTLRMALRNVSRQRKRTILLGGAIAFGVLIITLVQSFTGGLVDSANARVTELLGGHLYMSGQEVSESGRVISVVREQEPVEAALKLIEDEVASTHYRSSASGEMIFGSRVTTVSINGVDWANEPGLTESLDLIAGDTSALADPRTIMLPAPVADDLGVEVGETVLVRLASITGQQSVGEFVVGGFLRDAGMLGFESTYADKAYLNALIGMSPDQYQQAVVSLIDTRKIERVAAVVERHLGSFDESAAGTGSPLGESQDGMGRAGGGGPGGMIAGLGSSTTEEQTERWDGTRFEVTTINDVLEPVMTVVTILNQVSLGLFLVLLVITMVGLLNTFRMILIERTREIGTIRAVGMQRNQVRNLFLIEALVLALGGAIAGLVLAFVAGAIVSLVPISTATPLVMFLDGGSFAFPIDVAGVVATLVVLTLITLASAHFPARQAARMRPADALRASY